MAKFRIRSKAWDWLVVAGTLLLVAAGFGGVFVLRAAEASALVTLLFVVGYGLLTFVFFAGPGIVFVARKRIPVVKKALPGGTLAWVRSHLYLPVLALVAAWVHATVVPFRATLSSGKVLLAVGILVSLAGVARHRLIGVQKSAVNTHASIAELTAGQPREFRRLVSAYLEDRRPLDDITADVAARPAAEQEAFAEVVALQERVDPHFPRGGGQRPFVRMLKVARAVHAPLTVLLFALLVFHVWDVFDAEDTVLGDDKAALASAASCGECHTTIYEEWASSAMSHAQTSTIMEAQLPVTLAKNAALAAERGADQQRLFDIGAPTCVNCHSPVGSRFVTDPEALLPLDADHPGGEAPVDGGGDAIHADGVSCISCHTRAEPLGELRGFAPLDVPGSGLAGHGTMFGPELDGGNPLPVWIHGIDTGPAWTDSVQASLSCGACHNVKLDLDGNTLSPLVGDGDADGDFQLDDNELFDEDGVPGFDDLILQTTFDEWQDYVAFYEQRIRGDDRTDVTAPLGCVDCHMPAAGTGGVVDYAPGLLPVPGRDLRSHSFIGVDYDLDPAAYTEKGLGEEAVAAVLAERKALLQTAVTLEVSDVVDVQPGIVGALVTVRNNLLGHTFPTGFAFARQFWLEVSAADGSGDPVCLAPLDDFPAVPCASGDVEHDQSLPQCDPVSHAAVRGVDRTEVPNGRIDFARAFPVGECDPYLTNFQKILTDGTLGDDGLAAEVVYQSFLPNVVQVRQRVADGQLMAELQSTRLVVRDGELAEGDTAQFAYLFAADRAAAVEVTATLRFRHLPPEFIETLGAELDALTDVPDEARIDPDELIDRLAVTDVVTAFSGGGGPVLACVGPQNRRGATILDCVEEELEGDDRVVLAAGGASLGPVGGLAMGVVAVVGVLGLARRRLSRAELLWTAAVLAGAFGAASIVVG